uniref:Uncharacterized protein n=1 Tax=Parascaris univalens TaxID=6257 RepID=A0A915A394_PARUN
MNEIDIRVNILIDKTCSRIEWMNATDIRVNIEIDNNCSGIVIQVRRRAAC